MASIKIRAKNSDGTTTVKAIIRHPMETGLRKDKKTGKMKPAHFIQEINCEHNGKNVMTALWGIAISKDPYLSFKFKGAAAGDTVKLTWTDNQGNTDTKETQVK
ncbi:MAG: thiosulfate oxidation carrier complex protein SoxZ [Gammaproteobacteria bacterium]